MLDRPEQSSTVLLDASNLYPGLVVDGCTTVRYDGTIPVLVRMSGRITGGSGLEEHVRLTLASRVGDDCDDATATADVTTATTATPTAGSSEPDEVFRGTLAGFGSSHQDFGSGVDLALLQPGDHVLIESWVTIVDDDDAAGRDTQFAFVVEARPA